MAQVIAEKERKRKMAKLKSAFVVPMSAPGGTTLYRVWRPDVYPHLDRKVFSAHAPAFRYAEAVNRLLEDKRKARG